MPKSTEKEPLLFVDTTYKGCFVNEQSFFKTPTPKPKDIIANNYVHNFDQLGESSFQSLIPSNVSIHEVVEEQSNIIPTPPSCDEVVEFAPVDEDESCPYETVNILVDYSEHQVVSSFNEEVMSLLDEEDVLVKEENAPVIEDVIIHQAADMNNVIDVVDDSQEEAFDCVSESNEEVIESVEESCEEVVNRVHESHEEVIDHVGIEDLEGTAPALQLDEKQQEILMFIQDLTNRPSMMKAPIVQIVKKDGSLKSGMIEIVDDWHITIDNLMDEVETISLTEIEGIRILHL